MNDTTQLRGACPAPNTNYQSRQWAERAIDGELSKLANSPDGTNVNKPGNPVFISMLKIADIVVSGYVPEHEAINGVKKSLCKFTHIDQKEIDYQWQRAMKRATPRHPSQQNRVMTNTAPIIEKEKSWSIYEYDLSTGKNKLLRHVPPKTVAKARYLAGVISNFLETGEIAKTLNFGLSVRFETVNGTLVRIQFHKHSQLLADCVYVAVLMAGCSLWYPLEDYKNGWFDFIAS